MPGNDEEQPEAYTEYVEGCDEELTKQDEVYGRNKDSFADGEHGKARRDEGVSILNGM